MKSKEDSKIGVHDAGGSLNFIRINEKEVEVLESKIFLYNHENLLTVDYDKLKQNDDSKNRAEIYLIFRIKSTSKLLYEPSKEKLVDYYFTSHNSDLEYKQVKRKAEISYLLEKSSSGSTIPIIDSNSIESDSIECKIRDANGIIGLELTNKNGTGNPVNIRDSRITLEFRHFLVDEYKLSDVYAPTWPSPKESDNFWTTKKNIVAVLLVVIVSIIFFFREKIWRWWKGGTKQEEKVREQLDIF